MSDVTPTPGAVLRAERESLGVTVREVSETLNLGMSVVEAIEADDYGRLPGPVYTRGYVRAYARLLELDPEPLLTALPRPEEPAPPRAAAEALVWDWIRRRPGLVLGVAGAVLLGLVVLLLVLLWPNDAAGPTAAVPASGTAPVPASGTAPEEGMPADEPAPDLAYQPAGEPVATEPAPATEAAPEGAAGSEPELAADDGQAPRRITATGDDLLSFQFADDCWVEVRDSAGTSLYSDINRAGTALDLAGRGPFRILLGYAPGVRLTFNGEPVPLAPHTRNNVATLVVGQ